MAEKHPLEQAFELSAYEILDVILNRNRCLIAVRGAIAEEHLKRKLQFLKAEGQIEDFEEYDKDGQPDFVIFLIEQRFRLECKNVEKQKGHKEEITIDFQRTRAPTGARNPNVGREGRYYKPEEFEVLAACLWNRTGKWTYVFVATKDLPRHSEFPDRLSNRVTVPLHADSLSEPWSHSLVDVLKHLIK